MAFDEDRERARMESLGNRELSREANSGDWPMTLDEIARSVSWDYRVAALRLEAMQEQSIRLDRDIANVRFAAQRAQEDRENRWREMSLGRRLLHMVHVMADAEIVRHEMRYDDALVKQGELMARKPDVARELSKAEHRAEIAMEKARPEAEEELGNRQARADLAREIWRERQDEREWAQERINEIETYNNAPPAWELDRINELALNRDDNDELGL